MPAVAVNGGHATERFSFDSDGRIHHHKQQDCEAVITLMREAADMRRSRRPNTQEHMRLLGSVPNVLALAWANEWGVKLFSKEWLEKTKARLRHDPDWKLLRSSG